MTRLLADNHEPGSAWGRHVRQAVVVYRSLRAAGVVERVRRPDGTGWTVRLTVDLPANFALNQALSPLASAALDLSGTVENRVKGRPKGRADARRDHRPS